MQIQEARPPFVTFEYRAIEDRAASQLAGHYVAKDQAYAIVTPAGSKDRYENSVDNWFAMLETEVREKRFPMAWLQYYRELHRTWQADEAPPELGTALKNWPVLSPAQLRMCKEAHLRTVEDLAVANEETIGRLGMGGRTLKQKAQDWLTSAANAGKTVEEISALRVENSRLHAENADLRQKLELVSSQLRKAEPLPSKLPEPEDDFGLGSKL